jgi:hypothetical protein
MQVYQYAWCETSDGKDASLRARNRGDVWSTQNAEETGKYGHNCTPRLHLAFDTAEERLTAIWNTQIASIVPLVKQRCMNCLGIDLRASRFDFTRVPVQSARSLGASVNA